MNNFIFAVFAYLNFLQIQRTGISSNLRLSSLVPLLILCATILWVLRHLYLGRNGMFYALYERLVKLPVPKSVFTIFSLVILFHLYHIGIDQTVYPISTVEMFRVGTKNVNFNPTHSRFKYYHLDENGEVHILNMRREHIYYFSRYLGWRWNNEYTFSATYDVAPKQAHYDFLVSELSRKHGIDKLYVGLQEVNYRDRTVNFFTDPEIIKTKKKSKLSIYVPEHQEELR